MVESFGHLRIRNLQVNPSQNLKKGLLKSWAIPPAQATNSIQVFALAQLSVQKRTSSRFFLFSNPLLQALKLSLVNKPLRHFSVFDSCSCQPNTVKVPSLACKGGLPVTRCHRKAAIGFPGCEIQFHSLRLFWIASVPVFPILLAPDPSGWTTRPKSGSNKASAALRSRKIRRYAQFSQFQSRHLCSAVQHELAKSSVPSF